MRKTYFYHALMFLSIFFFALVSIHIIEWKKDQNKSIQIEQVLQKERKQKTSTKKTTSIVNPPRDKQDSTWNYEDTPFIEVDFSSLQNRNKDIIGWLEVTDTKVDYPVVQTNNNDYYLNHSFDHTSNSSGWIYGDYRNDFNLLNQNNIIYGHGRLDGTKFGSLRELLNEDWFKEPSHHIIQLSTLTYNSIWQIVSVYTIPKESYYLTTHFNSKTFESFLDTIQTRSKIIFPTSLNTKDKILTLSTCQNDYGERLVVHSKLIKKETRN